MTGRIWLRPAWLFNRRVGIALLWLLLVAGVAVAVNVAGIHVVGSINGWERWLHAHSAHFLAWRLALYAGTAYGWWWMRQRLQQREPGAGTHQRLLRVEIAAVTTIVLLEGSQLLRHG
ncbi:hypothetical protein LLG90_01050 [Aromatoleum toluclasticum]|uniref:hypothetical protein n=1 Tax=Aromatoleum toluclasticum TaxID=92003 RepID=UPI001D18C922|nr:hypothetical protein [Aromatoleum toluclasticum]MCC4113931.1 hypothetical protein [Aromatoleum toluclasticum]